MRIARNFSTVVLSLALLCSVAFAFPQHPRPQKPSANPTGAADTPPEMLLAKAQAAMQKQDYAAAARAYSAYLVQKPDDAVAHFQLGYAFTALKQADKAEEQYRKATELDPKMTPAYLNLGLTLLDKDPAAAIEPLRKAAELEPAKAQSHFLLGWALERSGKLGDAVPEYQAAEKFDPKNFDTHFFLARTLLAENQAAAAEPEFRQALALRPDASPARLGLAESLIAQKKSAEAAAQLGGYLEAHPQDTATRVQLASVLVDLGKDEKALAQLDRAAASGPESVAALKLRSEINFRRKKYTAAAAALETAAALAPQDAEIHARLGRVLLEEKNYSAAVSELRRALEIKPGVSDTLHDLLVAEYLAGNYPATLQILDFLAPRETPTAGAWFVRATCYDKLGRAQEALEAYEKFLALNGGKINNEYFEATGRVRFLSHGMKKK